MGFGKFERELGLLSRGATTQPKMPLSSEGPQSRRKLSDALSNIFLQNGVSRFSGMFRIGSARLREP